MMKLIPLDKIFENPSGVVSPLGNQLKPVLTDGTRHFMFSGDCVNSVTLKIEFLYVEVKHFHLTIFLVSQCKSFNRF